jgi:hypothetical protein
LFEAGGEVHAFDRGGDGFDAAADFGFGVGIEGVELAGGSAEPEEDDGAGGFAFFSL